MELKAFFICRASEQKAPQPGKRGLPITNMRQVLKSARRLRLGVLLVFFVMFLVVMFVLGESHGGRLDFGRLRRSASQSPRNGNQEQSYKYLFHVYFSLKRRNE